MSLTCSLKSNLLGGSDVIDAWRVLAQAFPMPVTRQTHAPIGLCCPDSLWSLPLQWRVGASMLRWHSEPIRIAGAGGGSSISGMAPQTGAGSWGSHTATRSGRPPHFQQDFKNLKKQGEVTSQYRRYS